MNPSAHGGRLLFVVELTLAAALAHGCRGDAQHAQADAEGAQRTVEAYYRALAAGDCAALQSLALGPMDERGCREVLGPPGAGPKLVEIRGSTVDGRDPTARLVHTVIDRRGARLETLTRVVSRDGAWRVPR